MVFHFQWSHHLITYLSCQLRVNKCSEMNVCLPNRMSIKEGRAFVTNHFLRQRWANHQWKTKTRTEDLQNKISTGGKADNKIPFLYYCVHCRNKICLDFSITKLLKTHFAKTLIINCDDVIDMKTDFLSTSKKVTISFESSFPGLVQKLKRLTLLFSPKTYMFTLLNT